MTVKQEADMICQLQSFDSAALFIISEHFPPRGCSLGMNSINGYSILLQNNTGALTGPGSPFCPSSPCSYYDTS